MYKCIMNYSYKSISQYRPLLRRDKRLPAFKGLLPSSLNQLTSLLPKRSIQFAAHRLAETTSHLAFALSYRTTRWLCGPFRQPVGTWRWPSETYFSSDPWIERTPNMIAI